MAARLYRRTFAATLFGSPGALPTTAVASITFGSYQGFTLEGSSAFGVDFGQGTTEAGAGDFGCGIGVTLETSANPFGVDPLLTVAVN